MPAAQQAETTVKKCPKCAEEIQDEAKVCRFCGHNFEPPPRKLGIGAILAIGVLVLLFVVALGSEGEAPGNVTAAAPMTPEQVAECRKLITQGEKANLIRDRPSPNRIDVEDDLWRNLPAAAKRGFMLALRCEVVQGKTDADPSYVVAYGYRSGKRLAMASEVGVSLD